ncbi:septum site-determining protein Ssd [Mycolicibacterium sp. XJ1819]
MTTPPETTSAVLALVADPVLRADVDRICAAARLPVVHATEPSGPRAWTGAVAVILDGPAARRSAGRALPRRAWVVLVGHAEPDDTDWQSAIAVGAQRVLVLPGQDGELMSELSGAAEAAVERGRRGAVVAVVGGRGGAGASVFATALARIASEVGDTVLVDADPWGGGIDLVLGSEADSGLRWPDLQLRGGRLTYPALRDALPRYRGISVLSGSRDGGDIDAAPLGAVVDAGSRGGATVVCDLPRRSTPAAVTAIETADLVVVIAPADVRSCAAAAAAARWVAAVNPNTGLVVRGPAPGGLRCGEVAGTVGLPLLAAMRPQPGVAEALERGGLRMRRRSPLAVAAREVLAVLRRHQAVVPT